VLLTLNHDHFPELLTPHHPYDHSDPQPLISWRSKIKGPVECSADLSRYIPMCWCVPSSIRPRADLSGDMINGGHVGVPQVVDPQPGKPCRLDRWFPHRWVMQ
jgi:hypothetical protein